MNGTGTDRFGGVAGRVMRESMGGSTFLSGVTILLPLLLLSFALGRAGADRAPAFIAQVAVAVALSRFALNGYAGQWRGTVFSKVGGDWIDVLMVALRFAVLSAVWLVPLLLLGFRPGEVGGALTAFAVGISGGKTLALGAVYFTCVTLSPPLFLVVSVSAREFTAIFSPDHWRELFSGRKGDLFLVYALYLGGTAMAALLFLPITVAAAGLDRNLAFLVGGCGFAFLAGLSLNLLGRLCGFFAASGEEGAEEPSELIPAPLEGLPEPAAPSETKRARSPLFRVVETAVGGGPAGPKETGAASPELTQFAEMSARVKGALQVFEEDPDRAIRDLEEWDEKNGPNPVAQCVLSTLLFRAGREMEGVELGRRAIPLALRRGSQRQAAAAYRVFVNHADELDLKPDEALRIANSLRVDDRLDAAASTYRDLIEDETEGTAAVKGLVQTADAYLHRKGSPEKAIDIYDFLLEHQENSPLADFMREGRDEAERLLARRP